LALAFLVSAVCLLPAQSYAPPKSVPPTDDQKKEIIARAEKLQERLNQVQRRGVRDPILADAAIYLKAAQWITRHDEFYGDQTAAWTLDVLAEGLLRAEQAKQGDAPWLNRTAASIVRA